MSVCLWEWSTIPIREKVREEVGDEGELKEEGHK